MDIDDNRLPDTGPSAGDVYESDGAFFLRLDSGVRMSFHDGYTDTERPAQWVCLSTGCVIAAMDSGQRVSARLVVG